MAWRPIQAATSGWLSLLGLKNLGRNPDAVNEFVQPTTDMGPWWLRGQSETHQELQVMTAATESFFPGFLRTTEQEWIYIHTGRVSMSSAAAATFTSSIIRDAVVAWGVGPVETIAQPSGGFFGTIELRDLWLPPGFWLRGSGDGAIGDTIVISALMTKLHV